MAPWPITLNSELLIVRLLITRRRLTKPEAEATLEWREHLSARACLENRLPVGRGSCRAVWSAQRLRCSRLGRSLALPGQAFLKEVREDSKNVINYY